MLMPSALSCESSQQSRNMPHTRLQSALFASPPASPPTISQPGGIGNIFSTCRSLQALLASPAPEPTNGLPPSMNEPAPTTQLPTPPLSHAPPPLKLRLRPRGSRPDERKKVVKVKRAPAPRGANKRRRAQDDDLGRNDSFSSSDESDDVDSDLEISPSQQEQQQAQAPSTPKRARIAPEVIPLGLERGDYHNLHASESERAPTLPTLNTSHALQDQQCGTDIDIEGDGERWSTEDDRILVELVLDKLKLTKTEWQDCARSLGKDRTSLSRRWRSLMTKGDVGLKGTRSSRRNKLHATWR